MSCVIVSTGQKVFQLCEARINTAVPATVAAAAANSSGVIRSYLWLTFWQTLDILLGPAAAAAAAALQCCNNYSYWQFTYLPSSISTVFTQ